MIICLIMIYLFAKIFLRVDRLRKKGLSINVQNGTNKRISEIEQILFKIKGFDDFSLF